ncbi:amino acid deaminase [Tsukamurella strandjordii]|uniref:amino acid deaminase n=1 Tax=Tsukamurella TaxID=2060 RepID=UPI001C7CD195|nr:amino acid deaminase [Tsukamurella sp. TY48]GIZ96058.1 alanine racemase [Tsukamurella sp. TY48]
MGNRVEARPDALSVADKAVPAWADGLDRTEFLAREPHLSDLSTPVLVLDRAAMDHNVAEFARWTAAHDVDLEPHGKTTMAPALWQDQLDAGCTAITVANLPQLQVAVAAGFRDLHVANAIADPAGLRWLGAALDADPDLAVTLWADGLGTVDALERGLADAVRQPTVLVELGGPGGRTGARSIDDAYAIGERIAASERLRLGGVTGYEGAFAHDTSAASLATVDDYLNNLLALHDRLRPLYPEGRIVLSAGGSAYFDRVAAVLGGVEGARVVVRSGAYIIHDDGFYRFITPSGRDTEAPRLRSAMHVWARVISRPEPGLALLDVGRRDVSFDEGLPEPQAAASELGAEPRPLTAEISAVNDQHAFLRLAADDPLRVGDVVRLGLSHPCTVFDKWRVIPVVADDTANPLVVDLISTYF